jgi:hypothetical protein
VSTVVLLKRTDCRLGFGSPSLHVASHPLAPGDASCCPAYVAVLASTVLAEHVGRLSQDCRQVHALGGKRTVNVPTSS